MSPETKRRPRELEEAGEIERIPEEELPAGTELVWIAAPRPHGDGRSDKS